MSVQQAIQTTAPQNSFKMLKAMVGIGAMCGLLIVLTYEGTLSRIERNAAEALQRAIFKVIPNITKTTTFQLDGDGGFSPGKNDGQSEFLVYGGYNEADELQGLAIEASGQGYADIIKIIYGYDLAREEVIGIYVLESKETPGLGDKIEKDLNYIVNFTALDVKLNANKTGLINEVVHVKNGTKENAWEIDGITGATISCKAIVKIIGSSTNQWLPVIQKNKEAFVYTPEPVE